MKRVSTGAGVLIVMMVLSFAPLHAQGIERAVISQIRGTVEIQQQAGDVWEEARVGQIVAAGTRISTGFGSTAAIEIEDTVIRVRALSRLTIQELFESENVITTNMDLEIGRVRGEVRRASDRQFDFQLRGPTATASVRGTSFEFDGQNLTVDEGVVEIENSLGQRITVEAGRRSSVVGNEVPRSPVAERRSAVIVDTRVSQTEPDGPDEQSLFDDSGEDTAQPVTRAVLRILPVLD
ncbi:MAG: FecR domain-containing protein [Spirochaetaceae bacterium]